MATTGLPVALALAIMPSTWRTVRLRTTYPILRRSRCLVATATFPLLYNLIVLSLDRQVTANPLAKLALQPDDRGLSLGHCTALSAAGSRQIVRSGIPPSHLSDANHVAHHCPQSSCQNPCDERLIG